MNRELQNFETKMSLCDAPLEAMSKDELPQNHPADLFGNYWTSLNGGKLPQRNSFKPAQVPGLLPWIMLLEEGDREHSGDYLLRLHGTAMAKMTHGDFTGQYMSEFVKDACLDSRLLAIAAAIEIGTPIFGRAISGDDSEYKCSILIGVFPFRCADESYQVFMVGAPSDWGSG